MLTPSSTYHIFNHAIGRDNLFLNDENYRFFLQQYSIHTLPVFKTYAWCLLPNHFHFVVEVKSELELVEHFSKTFPKFKMPGSSTFPNPEADGGEPAPATFPKFQTLEKLKPSPYNPVEFYISKTLSNLFSSYTQSFNKVMNRRGSLFIKNFKHKEITDSNYFLNTVHYIHYNPVHHRLVKNIENWKWTSWHSILDTKPTNLQRQEVLKRFGNIENFIAYQKQRLRNITEVALEL